MKHKDDPIANQLDALASPASSLAVRDERVSDFAGSDMFDRMFREGMALVEETAAYLDGPGRQESRALDRDPALAYAAVSMELTTRLMQAASWLVCQRAIRDGDMSIKEAAEPKYRLGEAPSETRLKGRDDLPSRINELSLRTHTLYQRIARLDAMLFALDLPSSSPVQAQLERLRSAAAQGVFDPLAIWRTQD
jgi:regulator of CtrA degradation